MFVVYPEGLATMPVAPLWSVLFFLMMTMLGFSSQVKDTIVIRWFTICSPWINIIHTTSQVFYSACIIKWHIKKLVPLDVFSVSNTYFKDKGLHQNVVLEKDVKLNIGTTLTVLYIFHSFRQQRALCLLSWMSSHSYKRVGFRSWWELDSAPCASCSVFPCVPRSVDIGYNWDSRVLRLVHNVIVSQNECDSNVTVTKRPYYLSWRS